MGRQDGFAVTMDEELIGGNAEWRRRRDPIKKQAQFMHTQGEKYCLLKIRTWPATCKAIVAPGAVSQTWYLDEY